MYKNKIIERKLALEAGNDKFIWHCGFHNLTSFDTKLGVCELCNLSCTHESPRLRAMELGAVVYQDACPVHGLTDFHGRSYKCASCFTPTGRPRGTGLSGAPLSNGARAVARREGATRYVGQCVVHGQVDHYVTTGKCGSCFTVAGVRRVNPL